MIIIFSFLLMIFIDFMATNRRSKGERLVLVQVLNQRDQWGLFSAPLFMRMNLEMSCKDPALYFYAKYFSFDILVSYKL